MDDKTGRRSFMAVLLAAPAALAGRLFGSSPQAAQSNEQTARELIDAFWNRGDMQFLTKRGFDVNSTCEDPFLQSAGLQNVKVGGKRAAYRKAFPDLRFSVLSSSNAGNVATVRWRAEGTHSGQLGNLKPSGKHVVFNGSSRVTIEGGKISKITSDWEHAGLKNQVGHA
ncbi:MAG: ester cyclase [Thermoanaerobaculia bacterium]|nr:ester cyclase [Thermoanaerobaculia bacterium]